MSPTARFVLAFVIAAAGFALGVTIAARHFEPQLAAANRRAGELEHAYLTVAESAGRQNAAIEAERSAGQQRQEKARAAAAQAHSAAQTHYARAEAILAERPAPGADPCRSARDAFDAELRAERGPR